MAKARKAQEMELQVGAPDYWDLLEKSLHQAKALLWRRLQRGLYYDDVEAKAVMDAYWALKKVVELQEKKMHQLPLSVKWEEELPPAPIGLIPQEVAHGPTP